MLGHGPDGVGFLGGGWVGVSQPGRWFEQGATQVLEQPQPGGGHGEPAPAPRRAVEHGPDQGYAAGLTGKPADDLDPAACLTERAFDEVGVPYPAPVLAWEAQVVGELLSVGEQAAHRARVGLA